MIKLLIADDHTVVRQGIKQIVREMPRRVKVDEACDAQEVMEKVAGNNYDVVLLDITMPGRNGIDLLKELKVKFPDMNILILSMHPEEQYAIRALKAGAVGYIMKSSSPDELNEAIQRVMERHKYVSPSLAEGLACYVENGANKSPHEILSDREYTVMCLLASGITVKDIAAKLSLSSKTISTYRSRIMSKMNMSNTAQLINYVIQNGLLD